MVVALWWLMRVVARVVMMVSMMLAVSVKNSVIMQMLLRYEQGDLSQSKKSFSWDEMKAYKIIIYHM